MILYTWVSTLPLPALTVFQKSAWWVVLVQHSGYSNAYMACYYSWHNTHRDMHIIYTDMEVLSPIFPFYMLLCVHSTGSIHLSFLKKKLGKLCFEWKVLSSQYVQLGEMGIDLSKRELALSYLSLFNVAGLHHNNVLEPILEGWETLLQSWRGQSPHPFGGLCRENLGARHILRQR